MKFDINVGKTDSMIRMGVGGLLVLLALTGVIGAWGWIGLLPIATGYFKTCPAYSVLKMNTCEKA
jgi:hypothetical protein